MTAILGYARVSTLGQDLDAQLAALAAVRVDSGHVFTDKLSGAVNTGRPGLAALLRYAREGDTVVVTAMIGSAAPSPKSLAPLPNSVNVESCCAPYVKA
jgi:predicted site-specific integrase-resolvase